jgi:hypothetical protein
MTDANIERLTSKKKFDNDAAAQVAEEAFRAGFLAGEDWGSKDNYLRGGCSDEQAVSDAWGNFEPSEAIKGLVG